MGLGENVINKMDIQWITKGSYLEEKDKSESVQDIMLFRIPFLVNRIFVYFIDLSINPWDGFEIDTISFSIQNILLTMQKRCLYMCLCIGYFRDYLFSHTCYGNLYITVHLNPRLKYTLYISFIYAYTNRIHRSVKTYILISNTKRS